MNKGLIAHKCPWLIVEKIQQRRIVLEETEENNLKHGVENSFCNQHFCNGVILSQQAKRWREVKETEEPKLSLSMDDVKEIYTYSILINQKIIKFIKENS